MELLNGDLFLGMYVLKMYNLCVCVCELLWAIFLGLNASFL